jgi:hypothetical protein
MLIWLLSEGQSGEAWQSSDQAMLFRVLGSNVQETNFTLFVVSDTKHLTLAKGKCCLALFVRQTYRVSLPEGEIKYFQTEYLR